MASEREFFELSGPVHLTAIDWKNFHHRMSVAASLVQGACILERDRQQNRQGPKELAPPWWEFCHFELSCPLIDDADNSICGAIFNYCYSAEDAPKHVIAFRGTIKKRYSISRDSKLNLLCVLNELHESSRFRLAMQAVENLVAAVGPGNVWLAGYSLGSAIALLAGKNMARKGCLVETYLFNPPCLSAPIWMIKNEKLKQGIGVTGSRLKARVAVAVKGHQKISQQDDAFRQLSSWIPNLFVNPADPICRGYIDYFERRKEMEEIGAGNIEKLATQISIRSLLSGALGRDSEPLHRIPSAHLTINLGGPSDFKRAHGIHQWWNPNFQSESVVHQFR